MCIVKDKTMKSMQKLHNINYHGKVPLLVREIRSRMMDGTYQPGQRLPTRNELAQHYGFSSLTIQRAMTKLTEYGFIEASGRSGSFVASSLPHLTRYAVLFPHNHQDHWWSHLYNVIERECSALEDENSSFFFVSGYDTLAGRNDYDKLIDDVVNERVAGLIFASSPQALLNTPILDTPNLPRVAFMSTPIKDSVASITTNPDDFINHALDYLETNNRKKPAIIFHSEIEESEWLSVQKKITSRGMTFPQCWIQGARLDKTMWAEHITRLLFAPSNKEQPDSIIVADDNLVEAVGYGLQAENKSVPEEVMVVAHANFPWPTPSPVPAQRFGIDIRDFLKTAVNLISKQRNGEKIASQTYLTIKDEKVMEGKPKNKGVVQ